MVKISKITKEELVKISGGGGWWIPLLPDYSGALNSICGLLDGWNGNKHKGKC